jgi:hypothetical protein
MNVAAFSSSEKGFKVSPAVGMGTAELIATGRNDDIVKPEFSSKRLTINGPPRRVGRIGVVELI